MPPLLKCPWLWLVACLTLIVCAVVAFLAIDSAIQSARRQGPFWDKYEKIHLGMTREEVENILGSPMYEDYPGGGLGPHDCAWDDGQKKICVSFDMIGHDPHDRVVEKQFFPKTMWERLQDHVPHVPPALEEQP